MKSSELINYVAGGHDLEVTELALYGEPLTRPDGTSFALVEKISEPQAVVIIFEQPNGQMVTTMYEQEEIASAGGHNFEHGILQIMKTYIAEPLDTLETIEWPLSIPPRD